MNRNEWILKRITRRFDKLNPDIVFDDTIWTNSFIKEATQAADALEKANIAPWQDQIDLYKKAEIDLDQYGHALNEAALEFTAVYKNILGEPTSGRLFNETKTILRQVIKKFLEENKKNV